MIRTDPPYVLHEDETSSSVDAGGPTGRLVSLASMVRRSTMLMLVALGCVLAVFAAVVLPPLGLHTSAGLLAVTGFNVAVVGLGGHVLYKLLERRF